MWFQDQLTNIHTDDRRRKYVIQCRQNNLCLTILKNILDGKVMKYVSN